MTEQKFRKKLIWRAWLASAIFAIGMFLTVYTMANQGGIVPADSYIGNLSHDGAFGAGYYYGLSLGLTFSGIATFIRTMIQLFKPEKFKKKYIKETDERNIEIIRISKSISWYVTVFGILVATFFVPVELIHTLLRIVSAMLIVFVISYLVLQKTK